MRKKFIAIILATVAITSACGVAEEKSEEDIEIDESTEVPKTDSVTSTEDGEKTETTNTTTSSNSEAYMEGYTQTDGEASGGTNDGLPVIDENASYTLEQSDVNSNLWVITNTSDVIYSIEPGDAYDLYGDLVLDQSFEPGEVLYYYATENDYEISKDAFSFIVNDSANIGGADDIQCSIVTVSYDASKYDDSAVDAVGFAYYDLDDVWEAYQSTVHYQDGILKSKNTHITYFRLFDADGNVIYEPEDIFAIDDVTEDCRVTNLKMDPSILSKWDHAEFYVKTNG